MLEQWHCSVKALVMKCLKVVLYAKALVVKCLNSGIVVLNHW